MKTNIVGIIIALILTFVGMLSVYAQDTKVSEVRKVDAFSSIEITSVGTIYFTQSDTSAPDLKKVEFTGVGEFNCEKPLKLDEVSFEVKGVGEVNVSDLTCDELKVTLRGVGSADIHVVCDYLTARMSGVGDVTLSGTAGHADISKGGIGGVNTCNLKVGR